MIYKTQQPVTTTEQHLTYPLTEEAPMTFALFVALLWDGRRAILLGGGIALLLAAILAFALPFTYTATTAFIPPGTNTGRSSAANMLGELSALGGGLLGGKSQGDLFVGILKSQTIADALIHRFDLMKVYKVKKESEAVKILKARSIFELDPKASIVKIEVEDRSPERARDLANGYLDALKQTSEKLALTESSERRQFFEQRLAREKDDLANAEVELKQVEEKSGLIAPAGQTSSELQAVAQLRAQISAREVRLASLLHAETEENPDVVSLRKEIDSLQGQVSQLEEGKNSRTFGSFSTAQMPGLELEYIRKAREVKYHEILFSSLAKEYEAARLDEAQDSPLQVLDLAKIPDSKSGPHRAIIILAGLIAGLMGGVVWVMFRASLRASGVNA